MLGVCQGGFDYLQPPSALQLHPLPCLLSPLPLLLTVRVMSKESDAGALSHTLEAIVRPHSFSEPPFNRSGGVKEGLGGGGITNRPRKGDPISRLRQATAQPAASIIWASVVPQMLEQAIYWKQ